MVKFLTMKEVIWEIELENAANAVLHNKVILYPTDTIWGIGGHALNEEVLEYARSAHEVQQEAYASPTAKAYQLYSQA